MEDILNLLLPGKISDNTLEEYGITLEKRNILYGRNIHDNMVVEEGRILREKYEEMTVDEAVGKIISDKKIIQYTFISELYNKKNKYFFGLLPALIEGVLSFTHPMSIITKINGIFLLFVGILWFVKLILQENNDYRCIYFLGFFMCILGVESPKKLYVFLLDKRQYNSLQKVNKDTYVMATCSIEKRYQIQLLRRMKL